MTKRKILIGAVAVLAHPLLDLSREALAVAKKNSKESKSQVIEQTLF